MVRAAAKDALLVKALDALGSAVLVTDLKGHVVWVNAAFTELTGYEAAAIIGQTPAVMHSGRQDPTVYRQLWQTLLAGKPWRSLMVNRHRDGSLFTVEEVITPVRSANGAVSHFVALLHPLAARDQEQLRHAFLAYHDSLTGLFNREAFDQTLAQSLGWAEHEKKLLGLMFLDLDKFKPVNDRFGHRAGDLLLQAVASRLKGAIRKNDVVARIGGDEFAVMIQDLDAPEQAYGLAGKLVAAIAEPFHIETHIFEIGVSVGLAIFPFDGIAPSALLGAADHAMYRAKQEGRGRWCSAADAGPVSQA
jgi:diguanylate cyclase (GGDEF)-like protein/PAS domain S-box-containing protein